MRVATRRCFGSFGSTARSLAHVERSAFGRASGFFASQVLPPSLLAHDARVALPLRVPGAVREPDEVGHPILRRRRTSSTAVHVAPRSLVEEHAGPGGEPGAGQLRVGLEARHRDAQVARARPRGPAVLRREHRARVRDGHHLPRVGRVRADVGDRRGSTRGGSPRPAARAGTVSPLSVETWSPVVSDVRNTVFFACGCTKTASGSSAWCLRAVPRRHVLGAVEPLAADDREDGLAVARVDVHGRARAGEARGLLPVLPGVAGAPEAARLGEPDLAVEHRGHLEGAVRHAGAARLRQLEARAVVEREPRRARQRRRRAGTCRPCRARSARRRGPGPTRGGPSGRRCRRSGPTSSPRPSTRTARRGSPS